MDVIERDKNVDIINDKKNIFYVRELMVEAFQCLYWCYTHRFINYTQSNIHDFGDVLVSKFIFVSKYVENGIILSIIVLNDRRIESKYFV